MSKKSQRSNDAAGSPADSSQRTVHPSEDEPGLSLDQLSSAFAEMLASGQDPYQDTSEARSDASLATAADVQTTIGGADEADACQISPKTILEAMLFVGGPEPLTSQHVAGLMRGVRPAEIDSLVRALNDEYAARHCPYQIVAREAGYQLCLGEQHHKVRDHFYGRVRQSRLSQAAIEVLAIVAFAQPLSSDEVSKRRGKPSGAVLSQLVRRQLLKLERPEQRRAGIRAVYRTTDRFLGFFGLSSLDDLPQSEELGDS